MSANNLPDGRLVDRPGADHSRRESQVTAAEAAPPLGPTTYKVQKGDTPHGIAEKLGVSERR